MKEIYGKCDSQLHQEETIPGPYGNQKQTNDSTLKIFLVIDLLNQADRSFPLKSLSLFTLESFFRSRTLITKTRE